MITLYAVPESFHLVPEWILVRAKERTAPGSAVWARRVCQARDELHFPGFLWFPNTCQLIYASCYHSLLRSIGNVSRPALVFLSQSNPRLRSPGIAADRYRLSERTSLPIRVLPCNTLGLSNTIPTACRATQSSGQDKPTLFIIRIPHMLSRWDTQSFMYIITRQFTDYNCGTEAELSFICSKIQSCACKWSLFHFTNVKL